MSRILKHKKSVAFLLILCIGILVTIVCIITIHLLLILRIWCVILLLVIGEVVNERVRKKMRKLYEPFQSLSEIRNIDYLVIGDLKKPRNYIPSDKTYIHVGAPNRSLSSSYQVLRHTHSILKEHGGTVILNCGNSKKNFSIFDMPFLHPITIKNYHLENLKKESRFPVIFSPIGSIRFLIGGGETEYTPMQNVDKEIIEFCRERDYVLICLKKQLNTSSKP